MLLSLTGAEAVTESSELRPAAGESSEPGTEFLLVSLVLLQEEEEDAEE